MNAETVKQTIDSIWKTIYENKDYLIELDQQTGDGDLGISMSDGFKSLKEYLVSSNEQDLGLLMMQLGSVFNEHAPSSLGTILSFGFLGMAKPLKGKTEATFAEFVAAFESGINKIMEKAKSKQGEKTILDALIPAINALKKNIDNAEVAFDEAVKAAMEGSEETRKMIAGHGRAAYYGDGSIGFLDGGSVVGKLIFTGINNYIKQRIKS